MVVYIEIVILDNFAITAILAMISYKLLNLKIKKLRILFSSLLGTVTAVIYPLINVPGFVLILFKIFVAVLISFILFFKNGNVFLGGLVFTISTFALGGTMFALGFAKYASVEKALKMPLFNFPLGLLLAGIAFLVIIFCFTVKLIKSKMNSAQYTFKVKMDLYNKSLKLRGFLDTGNTLTDSRTGFPIVVVGIKTLLNILDQNAIMLILTENGEKLKNAHYEIISSAGLKNLRLLILKPDCFKLYFKDKAHIINDVVLGISIGKVNLHDCDLILQPMIIEKLTVK